MEYIDVIDKDTCEKTGISKPLSEIHKNGDWHNTIHAWLINAKNEILIQRRSRNKVNFPNCWDVTVGGHISSGEDAISGAIREIKEEVGVDVTPGELEMIGKTSHEVVLANETYFDNEKINSEKYEDNIFNLMYEDKKYMENVSKCLNLNIYNKKDMILKTKHLNEISEKRYLKLQKV